MALMYSPIYSELFSDAMAFEYPEMVVIQSSWERQPDSK